MKTLTMLLLTLFAITVFTSCHSGPRVVISSDNNGSTTTLEYSGKVYLSSNHLRVARLSPNGYISYKKNDEKLEIKNGPSGNLIFERNGDKADSLDATGRALFAEAVREIAKQQRAHNTFK